jgi:hydrogenase nickel incorporation protein HypA/HybF
MHEFSICQALVETVTAEMKKIDAPRPFNLLKVRIVVGELRQVMPDALQTAYEVITRGTPAEGSSLEIVKAPLTAKCAKCGWSGEIDEALFRCASCGGADIEVTGGMELYLDELEIQSNEQDERQGLSRPDGRK